MPNRDFLGKLLGADDAGSSKRTPVELDLHPEKAPLHNTPGHHALSRSTELPSHHGMKAPSDVQSSIRPQSNRSKSSDGIPLDEIDIVPSSWTNEEPVETRKEPETPNHWSASEPVLEWTVDPFELPASVEPAEQRTQISPAETDSQTPPIASPNSRESIREQKGRQEGLSIVKGNTGNKEHDFAGVDGIRDRVVGRLLRKGIVTINQVKAAVNEREKGKLTATLWRILALQTGVDREKVYREAAVTYAFAERKLAPNEVDLEFIKQVVDVFPEERRNRLIELRVVPIGYEFEPQSQALRVVFITHDPSLPAVRELMQELKLERFELQYTSEETAKDLLARAFPRKNEYLERMSEDPLAYDLGTSYDEAEGDLIDEEALEAEINRSTLINLFEAALVEAVRKNASDIHIFPNPRRQVEIHFRVDGRLSLWHLEDKIHPESLLAVIKDNSTNVDRFERGMAQDGFIQRKIDDALIRYRVSVLPIATAVQELHAESIVIRVLDDRKVLTDLGKLGMLEGALERFDRAIRQPHGMVILTGPTGSGKSTTLVAALHQVVTPDVNVLTVEDPVEYIIKGVRQIKLSHKLNLEQAMRAILRHDPDVVMVGEMRDQATAELAVKLANTGHLTFSTLHTNDAPSAVSRLYKMGLEPFLIAYAINMVVAQRLLRNLCPSCKVVDDDPDFVLMKRLGFTQDDFENLTFYKKGEDDNCKTCHGTGYKGRRAICEALYFSRDIRHMIVEAECSIEEEAIRDKAKEEGMLTLQDSAREIVKMGETSVEEMMRVTSTEE